ncbi:hypothetical protein D3C80_2027730 [compost metagenome]
MLTPLCESLAVVVVLLVLPQVLLPLVPNETVGAVVSVTTTALVTATAAFPALSVFV